jgi:hypothetical protein
MNGGSFSQHTYNCICLKNLILLSPWKFFTAIHVQIYRFKNREVRGGTVPGVFHLSF